ncbi:hypothetical protein IPZ70_22435 [Streptomyces polychromogenes]|nr:hypothetical protein [Streptomyces polychromogenes]
MTSIRSDALSRALAAPSEPSLRLLPPEVAELLRALGAPPRLAAHLRADVTIEDLLVSTADRIWKDKRVPGLEDRLVRTLTAATGREPWEEYLALDDLLTRLGADAHHRLAFQAGAL